MEASPVIKMMTLFRIKPGVSREECIAHYEAQHAPLIMRLMPGVFTDYRRNFVIPGSQYFPDRMGSDAPPFPSFDMITELWLASEEKFQEMARLSDDPVIGKAVADDEARFLDTASMVMFLVDERTTAIPAAPDRAGPVSHAAS